jgi:hypothetical protein
VSASVTSANPVRPESRPFDNGFTTDGTVETSRETASNRYVPLNRGLRGAGQLSENLVLAERVSLYEA